MMAHNVWDKVVTNGNSHYRWYFFGCGPIRYQVGTFLKHRLWWEACSQPALRKHQLAKITLWIVDGHDFPWIMSIAWDGNSTLASSRRLLAGSQPTSCRRSIRVRAFHIRLSTQWSERWAGDKTRQARGPEGSSMAITPHWSDMGCHLHYGWVLSLVPDWLHLCWLSDVIYGCIFWLAKSLLLAIC